MVNKERKMSGKENDTAAIFKTVVKIYESDYQLYRSSRSNKLKIWSEVVSRNVSLQNSKNVSRTNSKKTEVGFQIDSRLSFYVCGLSVLQLHLVCESIIL